MEISINIWILLITYLVNLTSAVNRYNTSDNFVNSGINYTLPQCLSCKSKCGTSVGSLDKMTGYLWSCSCEPRCVFNNNCCPDFESECPNAFINVNNYMLEVAGYDSPDCVSMAFNSGDRNLEYMIMMVKSCEGTPCMTSLLFDTLPVMETRASVVFLNKKCALCNGVKEDNFQSLSVTRLCDDDENKQCNHTLHESTNSKLTLCFKSSINTCPSGYNNELVRVLCEEGPRDSFWNVYRNYRNIYCLLCNEEEMDINPCERSIHRAASLLSVFDFMKNKRIVSKDVCNSRYIMVDGTCKRYLGYKESLSNCTSPSSAVEHTNYTWFPNDTIILQNGDIYNSHEYSVDPMNSSVYVCINKTTEQLLLQTDWPQVYTTLVVVPISLIALGFRIALPCFISEFNNVAGRMQTSLCVAMFLALGFMLCIQPLVPETSVCHVMAWCLHWSFLAMFSWTTAISVDIWRLLYSSDQLVVVEKQSKYLLIYSSLSWGIPVIIVAVCLLLDYKFMVSLIRPMYGSPQCMINNLMAQRLWFISPIGLCLSVNLILFTWGSILLYKSQSSTYGISTARKDFYLYIKIFIMMGVIWILGVFLSNVIRNDILSHIFIIINGLQGLFLTIASISSKSVRHSIIKKFGVSHRGKMSPSQENTRKMSASSTKLTMVAV